MHLPLALKRFDQRSVEYKYKPRHIVGRIQSTKRNRLRFRSIHQRGSPLLYKSLLLVKEKRKREIDEHRTNELEHPRMCSDKRKS